MRGRGRQGREREGGCAVECGHGRPRLGGLEGSSWPDLDPLSFGTTFPLPLANPIHPSERTSPTLTNPRDTPESLLRAAVRRWIAHPKKRTPENVDTSAHFEPRSLASVLFCHVPMVSRVYIYRMSHPSGCEDAPILRMQKICRM